MIDLHIHSNYSDGTFSIEEIISKAKELGLKQIAITDHNILKGSLAASKIADGIDFVIGTELSTAYKDEEVHLLSYFPKPSDYKNINFVINEGDTNKKIAIMETIENLNAMGIDISILDLKEFSKGIINRVHICMALMKKGYTKSINEGFEKYVGKHCPAYVDRKMITLEEAIEAVHQDGGLAVVAHPFEYQKLMPIENFLNEVMDKIDGIECFHPSATPENSKMLVELAEKNNKIITGGSDFHGANKPKVTMDMMNVDAKYMISK